MAIPSVLFPDIEASCINYLQAALTARPEPYTAGAEVSNMFLDGPTRQVGVRRDGGFQSDRVLDNPRLGIRVWAEDDATATDLALMVAALLVAWPDGAPVVRTRILSGPSSLPEENGLALRYLVLDAVIRGTQLTPA